MKKRENTSNTASYVIPCMYILFCLSLLLADSKHNLDKKEFVHKHEEKHDTVSEKAYVYMCSSEYPVNFIYDESADSFVAGRITMTDMYDNHVVFVGYVYEKESF